MNNSNFSPNNVASYVFPSLKLCGAVEQSCQSCYIIEKLFLIFNDNEFATWTWQYVSYLLWYQEVIYIWKYAFLLYLEKSENELFLGILTAFKY